MYMCCLKGNWFLGEIGEENPHEDGSVAYKCYIFSRKTKNMELDSGAFFGN